MRRLLPLLALLAFLATPAAAATLGEVRSMVDRGEFAAAREALDAMLAREDLAGRARDEAAILRADLEDDGDLYLGRLRALLEEGGGDTREGRLRLALGHVYFARGETDRALEEFRRGREKGFLEEGSLWEGICAMILGDASLAREALGRAATSGNASTRQRALLALGDSYRLAGDRQEAIAWYRRVAEDPSSGPGWAASAGLHEAECLHALRRDDEAKETLRLLLAATPAAYDGPAARNLQRLLTAVPETPGEPLPQEAAAGTAETPVAVQIGAFTSEENAVALASAARERTARRVRIAKGEDGLYRVLAGSFAHRDDAAVFGDSLGAALDTPARVVPASGD